MENGKEWKRRHELCFYTLILSNDWSLKVAKFDSFLVICEMMEFLEQQQHHKGKAISLWNKRTLICV